MTFGEQVKSLREAKSLSQQALADAIGVKQAFVSKLEKGDRSRLGADVYLRLCRALGVSCQHFEAFLAPPADEPPPEVEKPKRGRPRKT